MLFNPNSFLTAIKQFSKKDALNKLDIVTEFTKKEYHEIDALAKDGAYTYGFLLEGARWSVQMGLIEDARPKEMFSVMPVCLARCIVKKDIIVEDKLVFQCPVYRTELRGIGGYIFTAQLKTGPKNPPRKWILGGVGCILDVEGVSDEIKKAESK